MAPRGEFLLHLPKSILNSCNALFRMDEQITIVDKTDKAVGTEGKGKCHDGEGILHRGFLMMIFNSKGELLLAKRSKEKRLWPGFWDMSVASHVHQGESYE